MAKRFMKVTRIVMPFITVVILASQLMGCAALTSNQLMEELQKGDDVVIEYMEPDQTPLSGSEEKANGGYDYTSNTYTSPEEAEIGLVDEASAPVELQELSREDLHAYFSKAFAEGIAIEADQQSRITYELTYLSNIVTKEAKGKLPGDYESQYRNWRPFVADEHFTACNETVYATSSVNLRGGPSTEYDKVGSLSSGQSVTRVGIGTGDYSTWSQVQLADGSIVYVSSNYISTTKPVAQQSTAKPSGSTTQSSSSNTQTNGNKGQTSTPSNPSGGTSNNNGGEAGGKEFIDSLGQDDLGLLPVGTGGLECDPNA